MPDVKLLAQRTREQGLKPQEVISAMKKKGVSQSEIDRFNMAYADTGLNGLIGKTRDVTLAVPRFLFPQQTKLAEESLYKTGANVKDLMSGDIRAIKERNAGVKLPGLAAAVSPGIGLTSQGGDAQGASTEAAISALMNVLGGKISEKILSPVLKRVKIGTPKTVQASAKTVQTEIGDEITKILKPLYNENVDKASIEKIQTKLLDYASKSEVVSNPKALAQVTAVFDELNNISTIRDVSGKATGYGQDIFGEAGKALSARGSAGVAKKTAKQIAGDELSSLLEGLVPKVSKPRAQYGEISKFANEMSQPLKNWWMGGMGGMLAGNMLGPGAGAAVGTPIAAAAMPYTRFLARKALGPIIDYGRYPLMGALNQLLNKSDNGY